MAPEAVAVGRVLVHMHKALGSIRSTTSVEVSM